MSDLHKDCQPEQTRSRAKYNDDRFHQLNGLLGSSTSSVWTYLLSVNGGAAAGLLAFIGSRPDLAKLQWPYWVLFIFVVGMVLIGFAHAFITHKIQGLIDLWVANTGKYWVNEVVWSYVIEEDQKLVNKWSCVPWLLGWSSLIAFLVGITWAAISFRQLAVTS